MTKFVMLRDGNWEIYDISPLLSERTDVFPGDTPFKREVLLDISAGSHIDLSSIYASAHIGAHVDAPVHYHPEGVGIDRRSLSYYMGECQVISASARLGAGVCLEDLSTKEISAKRVLFRTGSFPDFENWNSDFNFLEVELIEWLSKRGVILVGIDTPSIDAQSCKTLDAHKKIFDKDMAILEGVVLDQVPDGIYELIALPLKLENADASPVRAVLRRQRENYDNSF